jgi:hypothetical protein
VIGKADGRGSWPLSVGHQIERAVHNTSLEISLMARRDVFR